MKLVDKINYLSETKEIIRRSIENKGVPIPVNTPFREYGVLIESINSVDDTEIVVDYSRIVIALNNKFGLGLSLDISEDEVVNAINSVKTYTLFSYVEFETTLEEYLVDLSLDVSLNHMCPLDIKSNINVNFELDIDNNFENLEVII